MQIGNGEDTQIFLDDWLSSRPMQRAGISAPLPNDAKVSHLISTGNWDANIIWTNFSRLTVREILSIQLPETNSTDTKIWRPDRNGKYSIKSGYWTAQEQGITAPETISKFWKSFWKQELLPKWKMFIWKIMQRVLPVAHKLEKRKIQIETHCKFCKSEKETLEHLFRDCQFSKRIWFGTMGYRTNGNHGTLQEWIQNTLNSIWNRNDEGSHSSIQAGNRVFDPGESQILMVKVIATMWAIWIHRNEITFQNCTPDLQRVMETATEYIHRQAKATSTKVQEKEKLHTITEKPASHNLAWTKGIIQEGQLECFQVDGAWKKEKNSPNAWEAAIAWVNEYNTARWEAQKILGSYPVQTESLAILHCIESVRAEFKAISIKTDSKEIVQALLYPLNSPLEVRNIIANIEARVANLQFISIVNVKREEVSKAHFHASKARK
ncbi:uncharacterized protein LOC125494003 [Beta vulgaris subsp. vulgaris]|uniref:uncharacterized protein LOC125494003 n=1 Tax=Beta vulgaris subsp. vulgaris TaxID=3555 RepID=UPI00203761A8|nr:uncharacterized protein LOC125494003 [Beta vulgaris subsp. vulgaris]